MWKLEFLQLIFRLVYENVKEPKTLMLRSLSVLILLLTYLLVANQTAVFDFVKQFSRSAVISQLTTEKELQYPKLAKEKASMLYIQTNADAVFVAEYAPRFINNYQDIVAWEGRINNVNPVKLQRNVVDKSSIAYQKHLLGQPFELEVKGAEAGRNVFVTNATEYTSLEIMYLYTCPIFNLDNSYSGYIALGWREIPYDVASEKTEWMTYVTRICMPQARALGRAK